MRLLPGLICLLPLLIPLAHAELIDDVNDRGELRIALEANTPPFNFKDGDTLTGFEVELGQLLANELDVRAYFIVTDEADLLQGVRVLDLTNVLSGPFSTYQMALLGAEVDAEVERARQLQSGIEAEGTIQLEPRGTDTTGKHDRTRSLLEARGRRLRLAHTEDGPAEPTVDDPSASDR